MKGENIREQESRRREADDRWTDRQQGDIMALCTQK